jgi:hypothetical protein
LGTGLSVLSAEPPTPCSIRSNMSQSCFGSVSGSSSKEYSPASGDPLGISNRVVASRSVG